MNSTSSGERARSSSRPRRVALVGVSALGLALGLTIPNAFAVAAPFHELDGNISDNSTTDPPIDWSDIFTAGSTTAEPAVVASPPAGILDPDFTRDFRTTAAGAYVNGDLSYFATGSKDTLDIDPGWQCKKTNNATDKGDWVNAYGYAARVDHDNNAGTADHTIFFFGLEKDDDNGTNNVGIWLLQDESVGCETSGGGNVAFTGNHVNKDLLAVVEYDSGGNVGTALGYEWNNGLPTNPTFSQTDAECNPNATTLTQKFCVITNGDGPISSPWWSPQKNDKSVGVQLQTNVFVEGYLDITNIFSGNEPCFASAIANSRASTSTTAALYDFVEIEAATCGPLSLEKYFDRNANGAKDTGEPPLAGWEFKIFPDGSGPTGTPLYTVYTDATGKVSIADVPTGSYDVWETGNVKAADGTIAAATTYWASDPTGTYPVKLDVAQTTAGTSVDFGNACFITKSFAVTGVPAGASLELLYALNDTGDNDGPFTVVPMTVDPTTSTTRVASVGNLKRADKIDWSYRYASGGPAGTVAVENDEVLTDYVDTPDNIGLTCRKANSTAFPLATLSGTKYKDVDADGVKDDGEPGIGGFDFTLYTGSNGSAGTQVGSATISAANGTYSFADVAPGTYSVVESPETGWVQTAPVAGTPAAPTFRTVTVNLGQTTATIGDFLNAPLTDLSVTVDPQTNSTFAQSISCTKTGGGAVGSVAGGLPGANGATKTLTATNLLVGTYTCSVTIVDP